MYLFIFIMNTLGLHSCTDLFPLCNQMVFSSGQQFDFAVATVPSLESVWPRSCPLPTAQWTWWQPCLPSTGLTGHASSRRPTESWSPVAAWLCSTTPSTWSSATPTAAHTHSIKCAKRCFQEVIVNVRWYTLRHVYRHVCKDLLTPWLVTIGKYENMKITELAEFHLAGPVSCSWYCSCWLTVTAYWNIWVEQSHCY